jgi:catechol-2,3-dioxygenase
MVMNNITIALIDKNHYEYNHFAILVEKYKDLPSDKGEMVQHRDGTTGCYVKDPDGNVVEFIHYNKDMKKNMGINK